MQQNARGTSSLLSIVLLLPVITFAQVERQERTLVINGQAGQAQVVKIDGHSYVDLESLAHIVNGSLQFQANRIVLSLPDSSPSAAASTPIPNSPPADENGLSRDFMKTGIEAIAEMREWASTLAYAIQNGYNVTEGWVSGYRAQAAHSVNLASSATATDGDRNAAQLLNHEFDAVNQWSDKLIEARKSMDTGKYALSADALRNEPLSQKIIDCGHFLGSMFGSGSFKDDPACH